MTYGYNWRNPASPCTGGGMLWFRWMHRICDLFQMGLHCHQAFDDVLHLRIAAFLLQPETFILICNIWRLWKMGSWCVAENRWTLGCAGGERSIQRRRMEGPMPVKSRVRKCRPVVSNATCTAVHRDRLASSCGRREHQATQYSLKCSYTAFYWPVHMPVLRAGAEFNHVHRGRTSGTDKH